MLKSISAYAAAIALSVALSLFAYSQALQLLTLLQTTAEQGAIGVAFLVIVSTLAVGCGIRWQGEPWLFIVATIALFSINIEEPTLQDAGAKFEWLSSWALYYGSLSFFGYLVIGQFIMGLHQDKDVVDRFEADMKKEEEAAKRASNVDT
jgi:hypothetical protein